ELTPVVEARHVRPVRCASERPLGRAGGRAARPRVQGPPAQPGARGLRPAARRLERPRVGAARPQGPGGGRRQPRRGVGRGRAARRAPARPARPRARGGALVKTRVALLTGSLGSGKTTLLSRLLAHPEMGETAVIVNELGEVAIDHHLLRRVDERTVVLGNGCVCCTLRGGLADELRDLLSRRDRGEIPAFGRVVVETTGLADPAPILYTLLSDPVVRHHFELERVITTVDAQHGLRGEESLKQAAVADRLVVTKSDLASPAAVAAELRR